MTIGPEIHPKRARPLPFVVAWLAMVALAGLSLLTAFLGLGHGRRWCNSLSRRCRPALSLFSSCA
jgi:hypothetical protein